MPLPLSINLTIARHLARERLRRPGQRLPLVLMLELTHACNLKCAGCGRILEYAASRADAIDGRQAQAAIVAAGTPVVSVSGGEPLLHPETPAIVADALAQGKVVYLCTNGLLLEKRLREFTPHRRFYFNVHLDGPPEFHDALTGLQGTGERAMAAITAAKAAGFGVTTNTTVYRDTDIASVAGLFGRLTNMGVDGLMVAPAFAYEVGTAAATLARPEAEDRFRLLQAAWGARNLYHTPLYMSFLRGERSLQCLPWGTVTYGPQGWRRPCYLLADSHADSFGSLMGETNWDDYGPGKDARCANCMLHSGFEPSVMSSMKGPRDWWLMIRWQMAGR
ncbi:MAG: adenosyl-hopene transferase HpnH [Anaerolineae bacterium]